MKVDLLQADVASSLTLPSQFTSSCPGVLFRPDDLFDVASPSHLLIIARAGAGGTILSSDFVMDCLSRQIPAVILDWEGPYYPYNNYLTLVNFLREQGLSACHRQLYAGSYNLIALPNLTEDMQGSLKHKLLLSFHKEAIGYLVLGDESHDQATFNVTSGLIHQSYEAFHAKPDIQRRYSEGHAGGSDSVVNAKIPTLIDYLKFAEFWFESYSVTEQIQRDCIEHILKRLREKLSGELMPLIAGPGGFDVDSMLLMLSILDSFISVDPDEAVIRALVAVSAALNRCLVSSSSLLMLDQMGYFSRSEALKRVLCLLCSEGLALGLAVVLGHTSISHAIDTSSGLRLMEMFGTKMIGHVSPQELESLASIGFSPEVSHRYIDSSAACFQDLNTSWHVCKGDGSVDVTHKPKPLLLSVMANNAREQEARERVMSRFPDDPLRGLQEFASGYIPCLQKGGDLELLGLEVGVSDTL
ncbi:MAG: hypothetical protein ACFCU8_13725 [Thermosynechococcaceae cyanobacterium]